MKYKDNNILLTNNNKSLFYSFILYSIMIILITNPITINSTKIKEKLTIKDKSEISSSSKTTEKEQIKTTEKEKNKSQNTSSSNNKSKQFPFGVPGDPCPCASNFPPCCTPEFDSYECGCIAPPMCGACPNRSPGNTYAVMHDSMLKLAMKDAYNQQDLAHKAKLQVELFQKAQDFAKEVGIQEMKAKQYANVLNEATRKAQIARAMMFQAASQVRLLADQTLKAISPMKCVGPRCGVSPMGHMGQVGSFGSPVPPFNSIGVRQHLNDVGPDVTGGVVAERPQFSGMDQLGGPQNTQHNDLFGSYNHYGQSEDERNIEKNN